jgi:hypothetical protein
VSADAGQAAEPRYRFVVAPRFSVPRGFEGRLERNGGIERDGERVYPQCDWRPLDREEMAFLLGEFPGRDGVLSPVDLALVQIPEHLRAAWWAEAERSGSVPTAASSFQGVFSKLVDFLRFKRLPLPERVSLSVAVSAPGLPSTRVGRPGAPQGLGLGVAVSTMEAADGQALACINLGDEASFVVLLELPPVALARRLASVGVEAPTSVADPALVRRYLDAFPRQSLLRVRLEPGEGLWLSPLGVIHDGWTEGKQDLDVMLHVGCDLPADAWSGIPAAGVADRG